MGLSMNRKRIWTWVLAIVIGLLFVWILPTSGQEEEGIIHIGTIVAVDTESICCHEHPKP